MPEKNHVQADTSLSTPAELTPPEATPPQSDDPRQFPDDEALERMGGRRKRSIALSLLIGLTFPLSPPLLAVAAALSFLAFTALVIFARYTMPSGENKIGIRESVSGVVVPVLGYVVSGGTAFALWRITNQAPWEEGWFLFAAFIVGGAILNANFAREIEQQRGGNGRYPYEKDVDPASGIVELRKRMAEPGTNFLSSPDLIARLALANRDPNNPIKKKVVGTVLRIRVRQYRTELCILIGAPILWITFTLMLQDQWNLGFFTQSGGGVGLVELLTWLAIYLLTLWVIVASWKAVQYKSIKRDIGRSNELQSRYEAKKAEDLRARALPPETGETDGQFSTALIDMKNEVTRLASVVADAQKEVQHLRNENDDLFWKVSKPRFLRSDFRPQ